MLRVGGRKIEQDGLEGQEDGREEERAEHERGEPVYTVGREQIVSSEVEMEKKARV